MYDKCIVSLDTQIYTQMTNAKVNARKCFSFCHFTYRYMSHKQLKNRGTYIHTSNGHTTKPVMNYV